MRLIRNTTRNGDGKYAIINLQRLGGFNQEDRDACNKAIAFLATTGALEYGIKGSPQEFFVLRLKDRFAQAALFAYVAAAHLFDREYADDVRELAYRSGPSSPFCRDPD